MKFLARRSKLHPLVIIGILLAICLGCSEILAFLLKLPNQFTLVLGFLVFLALLIPVALMLHKRIQARN